MSWQKAPGAYGSDPSVGVGGPGHALHDEVAARRQQGSEKAADQAAAGRLVHGVRRHVHADPHAVGDGVERLRKSLGRPGRVDDEILGLLAERQQHLGVLLVVDLADFGEGRSEERRVGKEWVGTIKFWWWPA